MDAQLRRSRQFTLTFLILALFATAGCDALNDVLNQDEEEEPELYHGLAVAETGDAEIPLIAAHDGGDWMAPMTDPLTGQVKGATYVTPQGSKIVAHLDESGFPNTLYMDGFIIVIRPADGGRIDLAVIEPDGNIITAHDLDVGSRARNLIQALPAAKSAAAGDVAAALRAAGYGLSIGVCAVDAALVAGGLVFGGPIGASLAISASAGCASALLSTVQLMTASDDEGLRNSSAAFSMIGYTLDTIGCASGNPVSCLSKALQIAEFLASAAEDQARRREEQMALAAGVLQGGTGDIQITLSWQNEADLDLWVTDPAGEKIWYQNTRSGSGGELDIDDTDGWGPENVFWSNGGASAGSYKVQVSHYSGPSPASFTVRVQSGSQARSYQGSVTDGQIVDVVSFDSGSVLPSRTVVQHCLTCEPGMQKHAALDRPIGGRSGGSFGN